MNHTTDDKASKEAGALNSTEDSAETKQQRHHQQPHEHLSGAYRQDKEQENIRLKHSFLDRVTEKIDKIKKKSFEGISSAVHSSEALAADAAPFKKNKKLIIVSVVVLLIVALGAVIIPNLPAQMQRSSGFAAYQQGNYTQAIADLQVYLDARPNDHAARYFLAVSALYTDDTEYAREVILDLYARQLLPEEPVGYFYALFNLNRPQVALPALDDVVSRFPDNVAARLLRGIMLGHQDNAVRQARDDFLQLIDQIYAGKEDVEQIRFLYGYLLQQAYPPLPQDFASDVREQEGVSAPHVFRYFGFAPGLTGFVHRLEYSDSSDFIDETLSSEGIANLYFAYMLINQNELQEAESILSGLLRSNFRFSGYPAGAGFSFYLSEKICAGA